MMKKILVGLVGLFLLAAFAGTLWFLYKKSEKPAVVFATHTPFKATIIKKAVATGSVLPRREIAIKPQVSGIVQELAVEPGDQVKKGDLIARVAIVPNLASLSGAEARLAQAKIGLENAETEFHRNQELFAQELISRATFDTFDVALRRAQQELNAAEDNLAVVREGSQKSTAASSNTLVRATTSGMVLEVPVEVGDSVIEANTFNAGTTLASVADMAEMIFKGKVDESEVGKLREGMDLLLTIGAIEGERYDAKLEYIAPKGVEENGAIQFEIRAALNQKPGDRNFIRANYSANADVVLARADDVLAIQESWLQFDDGKPYVEVETAPQKFERRNVETGISDGITIQVVSGLGESDKVKDPASGGAPSGPSL
jgi:HlyD family secretion protein